MLLLIAIARQRVVSYNVLLVSKRNGESGIGNGPVEGISNRFFSMIKGRVVDDDTVMS